MNISLEATKHIAVENATVDFLTFEKEDKTYYYFDSTKCGPPEPMVNAMAGLNLLKENDILIMHNHKKPMGLLNKVSKNFTINEELLDDGSIQLFFSRNALSDKADLTDSSCH